MGGNNKMKWEDMHKDAGFILLLVIFVMFIAWLTSCSQKTVKELCPEDTHLISYPAPGHGPNPFE